MYENMRPTKDTAVQIPTQIYYLSVEHRQVNSTYFIAFKIRSYKCTQSEYLVRNINYK